MTQDAEPYPHAVPAVEAVALPALEGDVPTRQCGRCRMLFDAHPALDARARQEWWLCPACEVALLPGRARKSAPRTALPARSNVIAFPRPVQIQARDEG
jgi:hypothetical protein